MLVSRDEQSCLVVSYKEVKSCIDAAFRCAIPRLLTDRAHVHSAQRFVSGFALKTRFMDKIGRIPKKTRKIHKNS